MLRLHDITQHCQESGGVGIVESCACWGDVNGRICVCVCRRFNQLQGEVEAEDVVEAEAEEEGQTGLQVHAPTGLRKRKTRRT